MLGSITPLGEWGRGQRWWLTTSFYIVGATLGGVGFGAVLGLAGSPLASALKGVDPKTPLAVLAAVLVVGLALDLRPWGLRLPTIRRQVSQSWLTRYRGWVYGLGFGLQLGVGVSTIVTTSTVYTTFAASLLSGSLAAGAAIGGLFGLVRASTVFSVVRVRSAEQLERVEPRLQVLEPWARSVVIGLQAVVTAALVLAVVV